LTAVAIVVFKDGTLLTGFEGTELGIGGLFVAESVIRVVMLVSRVGCELTESGD
jgi:hypothetical protein